MSWVYLIVAGLFEIGWPLGFKLSQTTSYRVFWVAFAAAAMTLSGIFLWMAQKEISLGTAYAVWTGIGAVGTFLIGIGFFGDALSLGRSLGLLMILGGVVTLKLSH